AAERRHTHRTTSAIRDPDPTRFPALLWATRPGFPIAIHGKDTDPQGNRNPWNRSGRGNTAVRRDRVGRSPKAAQQPRTIRTGKGSHSGRPHGGNKRIGWHVAGRGFSWRFLVGPEDPNKAGQNNIV